MTTLHLPTDGASGPHRPGAGGENAASPDRGGGDYQTPLNVVWVAYEGIDGNWHAMTKEDFDMIQNSLGWSMLTEFRAGDDGPPPGKPNRCLPTMRKPRGMVRQFLLAAGEFPKSWGEEGEQCPTA